MVNPITRVAARRLAKRIVELQQRNETWPPPVDKSLSREEASWRRALLAEENNVKWAGKREQLEEKLQSELPLAAKVAWIVLFGTAIGGVLGAQSNKGNVEQEHSDNFAGRIDGEGPSDFCRG